ncbi:hypothetical protein ESCAB7627_4876 [Escherichia albertii TW07627]|uniref:Uncharacterized protein n=1 Tax=Escherichia albertii (strain TW07627) TaxID=502347 RepID=A0ABC9NIY7_ESCAT|nr:hypothetical protein ESCAB7627_4876 [Escherichia albertii TW07627]
MPSFCALTITFAHQLPGFSSLIQEKGKKQQTLVEKAAMIAG